MSTVLTTISRNPGMFLSEMTYMFGAMLATNIALELVDETVIAAYVPARLQAYTKVIAESFKQAAQFKIAQFY